jgi:hypothetical protein
MGWVLASVMLLLPAAGSGELSYPLGVYALIDRVAIEPAEGRPERILVRGTFIVANDRDPKKAIGPVQGFLAYRIATEWEEGCIQEWQELREAAGTNDVVAFGARGQTNGTVKTRPDDPAEPPDYVLNVGIVRRSDGGFASRGRRRDYLVDGDLVGRLRAFPRVAEPEIGAAIPPGGPVRLVVRNILEQRGEQLRYRFRLGDLEATIEPGAERTSWDPGIALEPGRTYTWSVQAIDGAWQGPEATASFTVKEG